MMEGREVVMGERVELVEKKVSLLSKLLRGAGGGGSDENPFVKALLTIKRKERNNLLIGFQRWKFLMLQEKGEVERSRKAGVFWEVWFQVRMPSIL